MSSSRLIDPSKHSDRPQRRGANLPTHPTYRPDIDGLRAVAVICVLLFHVALVLPGGAIEHFSGGFVGVDVFFVISGFLITSIIRTQLDGRHFSLHDFYARRVGRILPALFVVIVASSVLASSFLATKYIFPTELAEYGDSVVAASLSISNVYFWLNAGYFSSPAESKLLLHTWSLAVEEQFYVFWPLVLVAVQNRTKLRFGLALAAIGLTSFAISIISVKWAPDGAFYLVFGRAWELLVGAALTLDVCRKPLRRSIRETMTLIGFLCILVAVFNYTPKIPFPGWAALLPCGGAALIILGGASGPTIIGRALSWGPIVFVGLISYSLYLWHWPVIVIQKATSLLPGGVAGRLVKIEVISLSFALAVLSWRFVETPFRTGIVSRAHMLKLGGVACVCLTLVGFGLRHGIITRLSPQQVKVAAFLDYTAGPDSDHCQLTLGNEASKSAFAECMPEIASRPSVLLCCDSHANHLAHGLLISYPHLNLLRLTGSGCKPVVDESEGGMCGSLMKFVRQEVLLKRRLSAVLLAGRWEDINLPNLTEFIGELKQLHVPIILFGPIVQYDQALPRLIVNAERSGDLSLVARHRLDLSVLDGRMANIAQLQGIDYISLQRTMCPHGQCSIALPNGDPMQFDYGHLTTKGSLFLAEVLRRDGQLRMLDDLNAQGETSQPQ